MGAAVSSHVAPYTGFCFTDAIGTPLANATLSGAARIVISRGRNMAIALAASQDHIATVFDSADSFVVIESGVVRQRRVEAIPAGLTMMQMRQKLMELSVNVLLCGAIATSTRQFIEGAGIVVIPFLKGNLTDVETGFFTNRLDDPAFYLPGCRRGWVGLGPVPCGRGTDGGRRRAAGNTKGQRRRGRS